MKKEEIISNIKFVILQITKILPDKLYLKLLYRYMLNKKLNLKSPKTFNEKIQWLKLYHNINNPIFTQMADKYEARKLIEQKIGGGVLIPLLGVWDNVDEIDFEKLPNQFVLKCNHNSGGVIVCKDKAKLDIKKTKKSLKRELSQNYYFPGREWQYKNIKRKIICEQYMVDESNNGLNDYKFMCFGGEVKLLFVSSERDSGDVKLTFFDRDWNMIPNVGNYPESDSIIEKPQNFDKMISIAEKLSKNTSFLRVDLYETNGNIYFGELTFHPRGGMWKFKSQEWNELMGSWIDLK